MPRSLRRPALGVALCLAASACYSDPKAQLDAMQQTLDLTSTLEDLASRTTELQFAIDSLRGVVARQDSTIAKLANLAGVSYPR